MLHLFLDSNILISHLCEADKYLCATQLLEKVGKREYVAYVSEFVYSESLGEMKDKYEQAKGLKSTYADAVPRNERERMVQALEELKKAHNINSVQVPLDQLQIYTYVRDYCFQAKDAPIVISVQYLSSQLRREVYLVTTDMNSLFFKAKRLVKTLHPSFHIEKCTRECKSYDICNWKNKFTLSSHAPRP